MVLLSRSRLLCGLDRRPVLDALLAQHLLPLRFERVRVLRQHPLARAVGRRHKHQPTPLLPIRPLRRQERVELTHALLDRLVESLVQRAALDRLSALECR
eukprot:345460-Prymnesium_polylepis.2